MPGDALPQPSLPAASAMRRALRRARDGAALDQVEAGVLLAARGPDLVDLSQSAARVRDAGLLALGRPGTVTYSRKVFIPLTRLCRDRCHYCTFAVAPAKVPAPFLSIDEVLTIARDGAALGCKEALFTLGDRPEDRWPQAREWLDAAGYDSTLAYLRAVAIAVLEQTGLLPHLNPGVLSWQELQRLKPVAPSMGMMLETSSRRLFETPGAVHYGSPDKDPAVRLRTLDDAGRSTIAFTTGVLVGIGETRDELAESLFDLRATARRYGHIQEVIIQNFLAKPDTAARDRDDAGREEHLAAIAVARLLLGPTVRIQAPPNLVAPGDVAALLAAGIDDLGGVSPLTPDHVNPERPWPHLDDLAAQTAAAGFTLTERLTAHPRYLSEPWLDPRLLPHVTALADPTTGLAADVHPTGHAWQEPDGGGLAASSGRTDLNTTIDTTGRSADTRSDFDAVYGDWAALAAAAPSPDAGPAPSAPLDATMRAALTVAANDPRHLTDAQALTLFHADGEALDLLCGIADDVRRAVVGDTVTYVVNRNINFTNVCYTGCRFCAFAQRRTDADAFTLSLDEVADRAEEAWNLGASEICMQGGIHPDLPGTAYFDLARAVKARVPGIHLHAFSPMEVVNGASRTGMTYPDWLAAARAAGVDTIPGTAAEILDDDVRWILTKGKLPAATWIDIVSAAHRAGLRSSATMMYGHVDTPAHWLAHLRVISRIHDDTGGFTEFVPLPFVHTSAPLYLAGVSRPGPTLRENRVVHAMARLLLHGRIDHIQTSWVKLGVTGTQTMLTGGADDLGGTLMEETISRMAGSLHGSAKTVEELTTIAAGISRPVAERTTTYGTPAPRPPGPTTTPQPAVTRPLLPVV